MHNVSILCKEGDKEGEKLEFYEVRKEKLNRGSKEQQKNKVVCPSCFLKGCAENPENKHQNAHIEIL